MLEAPTGVLKAHIDRHIALVTNGNHASGDVADVSYFSWGLPPRGVLRPAWPAEDHQLGEL
eukprot:1230629-Alexandrium_andersonii.AAC.1